MTVVSVSKEKKHLMLIAFDNGSEIKIDTDVFLNNALCVGSELSAEDIENLEYESDYERAKSRALWYLDRNDYTAKALYDKLTKAGFERKASAAGIARLTGLGVVDDRRFAENFAARCAECNVSRREAAYKMMLKGVPKEIASDALDNEDADESEQIAALIAKKYRTKIASENGVQKVYAALIRKGFSYGKVRDALKKYSEELLYGEDLE